MTRRSDIKYIVDYIYHDYMTRGEIVVLQNKTAERYGVMAWCDETALFDAGEDIRKACENEDFIDMGREMIDALMVQYDCENLAELVDVYFYNKKKIIRPDYTIEDDMAEALRKQLDEASLQLDEEYRSMKKRYDDMLTWKRESEGECGSAD